MSIFPTVTLRVRLALRVTLRGHGGVGRPEGRRIAAANAAADVAEYRRPRRTTNLPRARPRGEVRQG